MTTTTEPTNPIYCVKCRTKTESLNVERVTMKNGRPATRAECQDCGTKKFRIGRYPVNDRSVSDAPPPGIPCRIPVAAQTQLGRQPPVAGPVYPMLNQKTPPDFQG